MERKSFLLRLDPATMAALRAWASDDLRSLNGQMEFLLRRALREAGRMPAPKGSGETAGPAVDDRERATNSDAMDGGDTAAIPAVQTQSDRT
ncbi:MAG: hypothetical protein ACLQHS_05500 [Candidatus Limnocylindrales bacterium]|jgi:hypothetical protein